MYEFEKITHGAIRIGDKVVNDVEPADRDIAMVFQNYALYPHMKVYDNMAYGLRNRGTPKDEIDKRVRETAKTLELAHLLNRPHPAFATRQRRTVEADNARQPQMIGRLQEGDAAAEAEANGENGVWATSRHAAQIGDGGGDVHVQRLLLRLRHVRHIVE